MLFTCGAILADHLKRFLGQKRKKFIGLGAESPPALAFLPRNQFDLAGWAQTGLQVHNTRAHCALARQGG
jgi:hypothetical protein